MRKRNKGCLAFVIASLALIVLLVGWYGWAMKDKDKRAKADGIKYSAICDTISYITEQPSIALIKFTRQEIEQLKFYIVRNSKILRDTTVHYKITTPDYFAVNIPFGNFLKTDTIIIETKKSLKPYYILSGFHHYAYLHYGMFGYVGSYDCRFADEDYVINGKQSNGSLLRENGLEHVIMKYQK